MEILNEEVKLPHRNINPIQDGEEGQKYPPPSSPPYQFSPCNFYKRKTQPTKVSDFQF